jgi:hypothetical protein
VPVAIPPLLIDAGRHKARGPKCLAGCPASGVNLAFIALLL